MKSSVMKKVGSHLLAAAIEAVIITLGCMFLALAINFARSDALALVQKTPYEIYAPCPVTAKEVEFVTADSPIIKADGSMIIDAREVDDFNKWNFPKAHNIPYDFLMPVSESYIESVLNSGAKRILIYGDGNEPDTGQELAKELAAMGVINVFYIKGGMKALKPEASHE